MLCIVLVIARVISVAIPDGDVFFGQILTSFVKFRKISRLIFLNGLQVRNARERLEGLKSIFEPCNNCKSKLQQCGCAPMALAAFVVT